MDISLSNSLGDLMAIQYGKFSEVNHWRINAKIILHNLIKCVLGNKKFLSGGWPSKILKIGQNGLVSLENEKWRAHRNILAPSFSLSVIKTFIPEMPKHAHF